MSLPRLPRWMNQDNRPWIAWRQYRLELKIARTRQRPFIRHYPYFIPMLRLLEGRNISRG